MWHQLLKRKTTYSLPRWPTLPYLTFRIPRGLVETMKRVQEKRQETQDLIVTRALEKFFERHKNESFRAVLREIKKLEQKLTANSPPLEDIITVSLSDDMVKMLNEYMEKNKVSSRDLVVFAALTDYLYDVTMRKDEKVEIDFSISNELYRKLTNIVQFTPKNIKDIIPDVIKWFLDHYGHLDLAYIIKDKIENKDELYKGNIAVRSMIPWDLKRRFLNYVHKNGFSMSTVFRVALILYLKKVEAGDIKIDETKDEEKNQDAPKEKHINEIVESLDKLQKELKELEGEKERNDSHARLINTKLEVIKLGIKSGADADEIMNVVNAIEKMKDEAKEKKEKLTKDNNAS
ncbi:hypothetical protein [Sulfolobus tengchongensis spindle-shaped virus 3]|nr:hypothetical protein [Sulfolobus tengchongensis spindle-shaped virus 3]